jgi:hypothetical protein
MKITKIHVSNSKFESFDIDNYGMFRLTNKLQTTGLNATTYTTKSYMQDGQTYVNSVYEPADMELGFIIMKPNQAKDTTTYLNKIPGSTVENPNTVKHFSNSTIDTPYVERPEATQSDYNYISTLDGNKLIEVSGIAGYYPQTIFSLDILQYLERKYSPSIWSGKTSTADKVAIAKQIITKLTFKWTGYGTANGANKANVSGWYSSLNSWTNKISHTSATAQQLTFEPSLLGISSMIDPNGFVYFNAYSEAYSTAVSTIYTDYVDLTITVDLNKIYNNAFRAINRICAPHNGEGWIDVYLEDGSKYTRKVSFETAPLFGTNFENNNLIWQSVTLELVSNDPLWYQDEITVTGVSSVTNNGDAPTGFILTYTATGGTSIITNTDTGQYIKITGLSNGNSLMIDTREGHEQFSVNGVGAWEKLDPTSVFFKFNTGVNNFTISGVSGVTIKYNERFLGI